MSKLKTEDKIREEIKNHLEELLTTARFEEYHELVSSGSDWAEEKKNLDNLIKKSLTCIEKDDYELALSSVNKAIIKLNVWKTKLSKIV